MSVIQAANLGDLMLATLSELGEGKYTDLGPTLQEYPTVRQLLKQNRATIESGTNIQWNVAVTFDADRAQWVGMYATDRVDTGDVLKQATVPWRHLTSNYAFDRREIAMNRHPRQIVNLMTTKRSEAMLAEVSLLETAMWRAPTVTDDTTIFGFPYYIVKSASVGFTTNLPATHTAVAGLVPATYPAWGNYAAPYTSITVDDLIAVLSLALYKVNWVNPVDNVPEYDSGNNMALYTNTATLIGLEKLLRAQNENLGTDLERFQGETMFRRNKVIRLPVLDDDTTGPVYGLQWSTIKFHILRGFWQTETVIVNQPGQHTVSAVHRDSSCQTVCRNRRKNFVVSTGTTMPS